MKTTNLINKMRTKLYDNNLLKNILTTLDEMILNGEPYYRILELLMKYINDNNNLVQLINILEIEKFSKIFMSYILNYICLNIKKVNERFISLCIKNLDVQFFFRIEYIMQCIKILNNATLFYELIKHFINNNIMLSHIDMKGMPININILESVCLIKDFDNTQIVKNIIDMKIVPTRYCFWLVFNDVDKVYKNKKQREKYIINMVHIFIEGGYLLSELDKDFINILLRFC